MCSSDLVVLLWFDAFHGASINAALLGIDACPMEGIEPEKYNEILDLNEQDLSAVVVAAAGYRASGDNYAALKKVRFPKEEVLVEV